MPAPGGLNEALEGRWFVLLARQVSEANCSWGPVPSSSARAEKVKVSDDHDLSPFPGIDRRIVGDGSRCLLQLVALVAAAGAIEQSKYYL